MEQGWIIKKPGCDKSSPNWVKSVAGANLHQSSVPRIKLTDAKKKQTQIPKSVNSVKSLQVKKAAATFGETIYFLLFNFLKIIFTSQSWCFG